MKSNENQQAKAKAGNQREAENKAGNRKRHKTNPPAGTGKTDSCRGIFTQQITGVEPAFPAWEASVLPMNHICKLRKTICPEWSIWDSNPRPFECHSNALPTALMPHGQYHSILFEISQVLFQNNSEINFQNHSDSALCFERQRGYFFCIRICYRNILI